MATKQEERKKVLEEYLNELFWKFDRHRKISQKKYKELEELKKEGDALIEEIEVVNKLYSKLVSSEPTKNEVKPRNALAQLIQKVIDEPVTVVEALKVIFSNAPTKKFEPVELKNELENIRKKNLLNSDAENLLWITHSALKTLMKDNFIIRNESGSRPTYRKQFTIDEDTFKAIKIFGKEFKLKKGNNE